MKKVLYLITTLNNGGAEKVLVDIVNSLPSDKFDITVQTIFDEGVYKNKINSNIRYKTLLKSRNRIIRKIYILLLKIYPSLFYNKYIKDGYDLEIAFLEGMPTRLIAYSTEKKSKKFAWIHTDLLKYFNSCRDYRSFEENKVCYEAFDKIACVSNDVKKSFIKLFDMQENKIKTVYNLILDRDIVRKSFEIITDLDINLKPIVVSCGRLCEQKGFDRLLRIHRELCSCGLDHMLLIIGEGEKRKSLEEYIYKNNLNDTVKLLGYKENPYKYMRASDLYVCSSLAEGFSTVITEATIIGTPVISVRTAGADEPEYSPRCNIVVDNSEDKLYEAMKYVLKNPEVIERYKENQIEKAKYFETEYLLNNIIQFLED